MDKPIDIPANLYEDEVVCFMADRYRTTTERVMQCFLVQEAGTPAPEKENIPFRLTDNEMEILRELLSVAARKKESPHKSMNRGDL